MSATMARQEGQEQLEQSDMPLAWNMARMATGGCLCAVIEETQCLIDEPLAEVREDKTWGVEFSGNAQVKAAMERHPAMVHENQMDGSLPRKDSTAENPQARWMRKWMGAHPSHPAPHPPGMPLAPPAENGRAPNSEINTVPPGYVYIHTPFPNAQLYNLDAYANDCKRNTHFIPDLLTDEGISTGWYTICCVVMQLTSILQMTAACWANLTVKTSIDRKEQDCWVLLLSTISRHFKLYFKGYIYMHY